MYYMLFYHWEPCWIQAEHGPLIFIIKCFLNTFTVSFCSEVVGVVVRQGKLPWHVIHVCLGFFSKATLLNSVVFLVEKHLNFILVLIGFLTVFMIWGQKDMFKASCRVSGHNATDRTPTYWMPLIFVFWVLWLGREFFVFGSAFLSSFVLPTHHHY